MNMQAKFSAKGQIVIPKDVRERYRFATGQIVEVVETPDGVLLKTPVAGKAATVEDALAKVRAAVDYSGPRMDEIDWNAGIARAVDAKWAKRGP
jgi:AbrB family looped-hinge helix DNA binding protein